MRYILENARVFNGGAVSEATLSAVAADNVPNDRVIDCNSYTVFPGFADVHVHFREPGFSYKETIATGSAAAAHGGYTAVCAMPNLSPTPDDLASLTPELEAIERDALIHIHPYGTITRGEKGEELSALEELTPHVVAFSDDGHGVQRDEMMEKAMLEAKRLGKIIVAHCEDNSLLRGGYIHDGDYARAHGHKGICSKSEWGQIARDLELVRKTGCAYHICHISTKESVELIRKAKAEGLDVTCETAPHYLLLNDSMLRDEGRFKMNPPIRSESDRLALLEGVRDGTVDMIATDHAPHTVEEKSKGLSGSLMGVVGLECAFPLLYTYLVKTGELSLSRLIELMSTAPRERFGLTDSLERGNFTVFDLNDNYTVDPASFLSMGRSTPFEGWRVSARCLMTVCDGRIAYLDPNLSEEK